MSSKNLFQITRLNQPIGIWLLFIPCFLAIILAFKQIPYPNPNEVIFTTLIFAVGSVLMRSAGCVINDIFDRDFDKKVERTKNRTLAAKKMSVHKAILVLIMLLALSLATLLQLNATAILAGFFALPLVILYPLAKRLTNYPQIFLGITFNFGVIIASLQILNRLDLTCLALYLFAILWTVVYDTIYAHQDLEDDKKIGVKSTALKFGKHSKKILMILNFLMFLILALIGWSQKFGLEFFATILIADFYLNSKIQNCDLENPNACQAAFKDNFWFGLLICAAFFLA